MSITTFNHLLPRRSTTFYHDVQPPWSTRKHQFPPPRTGRRGFRPYPASGPAPVVPPRRHPPRAGARPNSPRLPPRRPSIDSPCARPTALGRTPPQTVERLARTRPTAVERLARTPQHPLDRLARTSPVDHLPSVIPRPGGAMHPGSVSGRARRLARYSESRSSRRVVRGRSSLQCAPIVVLNGRIDRWKSSHIHNSVNCEHWSVYFRARRTGDRATRSCGEEFAP